MSLDQNLQRTSTWDQSPEESRGQTIPRQVVGDRFVIRRGRRLVLVPISEVRYAEASGNYVRLHAGRDQEHLQQHLLRMPMKVLESILSDHGFVRIHRSTMVRWDQIVEIRTTPAGDHEVSLSCGCTKRWSRSFRSELERFLGG